MNAPSSVAIPNPAAPATTRYVAELDGFRAIAVWLVLVHHVFYAILRPPDVYSGIPRLLLEPIRWLGVDLFFVLSGLLITGILIESKHRPNYFKNFYVRRALRAPATTAFPRWWRLPAIFGLARSACPP